MAPFNREPRHTAVGELYEWLWGLFDWLNPSNPVHLDAVHEILVKWLSKPQEQWYNETEAQKALKDRVIRVTKGSEEPGAKHVCKVPVYSDTLGAQYDPRILETLNNEEPLCL